MEDILANPGRRRLLAAAVVPGFERMLVQLRPKMSSYDEWFGAIRMDDARRMEALLARGFDPNSIEPQLFDSSLIVAIRHKASNAIALLLSVESLQIDMQSRNGDTALMIAAWLGDAKTALALIDLGAEINRPGWAPLHYAAASGNLTIIRRLLDESAYIDAESPNGTTPLMMAARSGRRDALMLLLDEGADLQLKNERGLTAADFARAQGFDELARLLDERNPVAGKSAPVAVPAASAAPGTDALLDIPAEATPESGVKPVPPPPAVSAEPVATDPAGLPTSSVRPDSKVIRLVPGN